MIVNILIKTFTLTKILESYLNIYIRDMKKNFHSF